MLPTEYRDEEEQCRDYPSYCHHPDYLVFRPPAPVFRGYLNGTEAIDCYQQHGVLRHQTDGVIHRQPEIAEQRSQVPVSH